MYQVLYRKYRPAVFSDVWGQQQVTDVLKKQIATGRLSHAYLFTGSRGIGKTTCARILAKAVNCLHPVDGEPCNQCEVCRGIDSESIHEVVEMDAASNNGVGDVRDLQEQLVFAPTQTKYRVYIIDEVHMMRTAFNALLKTLEEPPPYVIFILATTEVQALPATILSRCQRFDFRRISSEDIAGRLEEICSNEGATIEHDAATLIGRVADGGMRDAVSLLDQCISRDEHVTEQTVRDAAGLAGFEHVLRLSAAIREHDAAQVLCQLDALHSMSKDMQRLCEELIAHYRSLMIINTVTKPEELIIATGEQLAQLKEDAAQYTLASVMRILDILQTALEHMGKGAHRRTELELALIRICHDSGSQKDAVTELEGRVKQLEKAVREGVQPPKKPAAPPPMTAAQSAIVEMSDRAVPFEGWNDVIAELKNESEGLFRVLSGSLAFTADNYILIKTTPMAADLMNQKSSREVIHRVIAEKTGKSYNLAPYRPTAPQVEKDEALPSLDDIMARASEGGLKIDNQ